MIGMLRGKLIYRQAPDLMLDVNGVGYELQASMTTFYDLPELNQEVTLHTHFIVREDAQVLYAFSSTNERELFRTLLKVNGVGPKMALAIVSGMTVNEFAERVRDGDVTGLTRLPGVGKKTAERLIIEMRDRLPKALPDLEGQAGEQATIDTSSTGSPKDLEEEAVTALLALGYKPAEASRMVSRQANQGLSVEVMIRNALKDSLS
ncbi:Holliday junction branch migration protein RuvA [Leucothrix pacifica]|uniref:Holliday junction branch migration complex subunit RuvA n=1 Tax=Leucothrix pacifica TaxID=1247513 RepID=A0A317CUE8_9GAMM|nr:Holliday junction branch migration protein RuvA [Leucothrix pacifica]PWR00101.1 Holliday junction branch migration protein RuvA [Leucothrix pacifica]